MTYDAKRTLSDNAIHKIQKLIRANLDASEGFIECADKINDESIAAFFRDVAEERTDMATELQNAVQAYGAEVERDGSSTHTGVVEVNEKARN